MNSLGLPVVGLDMLAVIVCSDRSTGEAYEQIYKDESFMSLQLLSLDAVNSFLRLCGLLHDSV